MTGNDGMRTRTTHIITTSTEVQTMVRPAWRGRPWFHRKHTLGYSTRLGCRDRCGRRGQLVELGPEEGRRRCRPRILRTGRRCKTNKKTKRKKKKRKAKPHRMHSPKEAFADKRKKKSDSNGKEARLSHTRNNTQHLGEDVLFAWAATDTGETMF